VRVEVFTAMKIQVLYHITIWYHSPEDRYFKGKTSFGPQKLNQLVLNTFIIKPLLLRTLIKMYLTKYQCYIHVSLLGKKP